MYQHWLQPETHASSIQAKTLLTDAKTDLDLGHPHPGLQDPKKTLPVACQKLAAHRTTAKYYPHKYVSPAEEQCGRQSTD